MEDLIVAGMASMPSRSGKLCDSVNSLLPQVDRLIVFLNNYPGIPECLHSDKIEVFESKDYGDQADTGKFWKVEEVTGYYFGTDDDIIYPQDYTSKLVGKLKHYGKGHIVGVHGIRFTRHEMTDYYKDRRSIPFYGENDRDRVVNVLGTGTVAFHSDTISLSKSDFPPPGTDLRLAVIAKQRKIKMICVDRSKYWLQTTYKGGPSMASMKDSLRSIFNPLVMSENPWVKTG